MKNEQFLSRTWPSRTCKGTCKFSRKQTNNFNAYCASTALISISFHVPNNVLFLFEATVQNSRYFQVSNFENLLLISFGSLACFCSMCSDLWPTFALILNSRKNVFWRHNGFSRRSIANQFSIEILIGFCPHQFQA